MLVGGRGGCRRLTILGERDVGKYGTGCQEGKVTETWQKYA